MSNKINYQVKRIADGIYAIDEFSMAYIYVIEGTERALILDTGTGVYDLRSITDKIITKPFTVAVTHGHMDHVGGIGQFDTVHIHREDLSCFDLPPEINPVGLIKRRKYCDRAFVAYGEEHLPFSKDTLVPVDMSKINLIPFDEGDVFDLGGRTLEVIHVPGHSPGSCCFLDREDRILFSGDNFAEGMLLSMGNTDRECVQIWLDGAEKVLKRESEFDSICAGHFCPLDRELFHDMFTLARRILCGESKLQICQLDEMLGPMYHYGRAYFSMDPANVQTRDYTRIKNPRRY